MYPESGYEPGEQLATSQVHKQVDTNPSPRSINRYGRTKPKSYSIEKLNESNYRSWSQVIESRLDDQDLWEVVQGKDKKPERPTPAPQSSQQAAATDMAMEEYETMLETWMKKAKKARKMIISTISPSVMTYVEGTRDPAEMWTILEGRYKPKTRVTLRQLQRQVQHNQDDGR